MIGSTHFIVRRFHGELEQHTAELIHRRRGTFHRLEKQASLGLAECAAHLAEFMAVVRIGRTGQLGFGEEAFQRRVASLTIAGAASGELVSHGDLDGVGHVVVVDVVVDYVDWLDM